MARGRPRKPTALRLIEGTGRPCRVNRNEPVPRPGPVTCPRWLVPEAKKLWRQLAPEMRRLGLLTPLDRGPFAALCQCWARWRQAEEVLAEEGMSMPGHRGVLRKHPLTSVAAQYQAALKVWCQEFGLTPAGRSRISVDRKPESDDPMEGLVD